jgi:type II secretory ATPase GspE/PulE/Tfp pilus assembly ATPase PilB-like protein/CheY-like chemotaxis protein
VTERITAANLPFLDGWLARPLVEGGVITSGHLKEAQESGDILLWDACVRRGWAPSAKIAATIAGAFKVPVADLTVADARLAPLLPEAVARRYKVIALSADSGRITLATSDPRDLNVESELRFLTGRDVSFAVAPPEAISERLDELYRPEASVERLLGGLEDTEIDTEVELGAVQQSRDPALEAPVAKLVGALLAEAVRDRASDVHFDPDEGGLTVRFRVDGVLREVMRLPTSAGAAAVRRVKVMAKLDVANPLITQDGRAAIRVDGKVVDLRVATAPVARRGEKSVVRILDGSNLKTRLADLGLAPFELAAIERLLGHREGMVLVTGPTGSGKTTTLYAGVNHLKTGKVNIVTVEDPVEYDLQGVSQIQVNESQGLSFAGVLRSVLRQDPDIVLVGEIRDLETATTAVQAGLTGHLVLSTLHTNDAPSAVVRLRDLGLEGFKIAGVLKGVIAQRLVRKLCEQCATPTGTDALPVGVIPPTGRALKLMRSVGCKACGGNGFRGRIAIQEIMTVDDGLARLLGEGASPQAVGSGAWKAGMRTLWESGLERVWDGLTTIDELIRVLGDRSGDEAADREASTPGLATVPTMEVPVPSRVHAVLREGAAVEGAPADGTPGARILVADDDEQMRRLLKMVLEREGYVVEEARDGLDALDRIDAHPPDLILLDVDMPRLDGFGVLEELRARVATASLPVVMLTGRIESEGQALDLGAQDFLAKPVQPTSLKARVRAVLRRSRL